jgi:hypothetical protein
MKDPNNILLSSPTSKMINNLLDTPELSIDHRPNFLVLCPSGSGKSFYIKLHNKIATELSLIQPTKLIDGDTIVKYPHHKLWWKNKQLLDFVNVKTLIEMMNYLDAVNGVNVLWYTDISLLTEEVVKRINAQVVYGSPSYKIIARNQDAKKKSNINQPVQSHSKIQRIITKEYNLALNNGWMEVLPTEVFTNDYLFSFVPYFRFSNDYILESKKIYTKIKKDMLS